jgi:ABC-type nitrate/sulfonate/bicarbonate transport system substrate-binding protein
MSDSRVSSSSGPDHPFEPGQLTRRVLLQRGAAGGLALGFGGLLQACGSNNSADSAATEGTPSASTSFKPSPGSDIPTVDVRFAMWPFGDTSMGFIGIEQGFFDDVGINMVPKEGQTRLLTQTPGELLSGQLDMASGYMPIQIQTYPKQPDIKMIQLHNTYVGNYLLASPNAGVKKYEDFAGSGQSFDQAAKSAVLQMKGKRVALSTVGNNREFFGTLVGIAGLTPKDFAFTVIDDAKMLQLARAGKVDFAMPGGAAQNVVLMNDGFFRVFGVGHLLDNLPPGDPRVVTALGHAGIAGTDKYVKANTETILRFMSVYYRIIDQIANDPDKALTVLLPHFNKAAGVELSLEDSKLIFTQFYNLVSFDQSANHLLNKKFPLQLDNVYVPQIEAAKKAGIYKASDNVTPEQIFVGTRFYQIMADLKKRYDGLKASGKAKGDLATQAAQHYQNRNYLDAYRLLAAASNSS